MVLASRPLTMQLLLQLPAMARIFFRVAENLKFPSFLHPPIGTAPRPQLLYEGLAAPISQKAALRYYGIDTNCNSFAMESVAPPCYG